MKQQAQPPGKERFEARCIELYSMFGDNVKCYDDLPAPFKEFVTIIGYTRVCSLMVRYDLNRGRSENECAIKYGITRDEVRGIKGTRRNRAKRKVGGSSPTTARRRG